MTNLQIATIQLIKEAKKSLDLIENNEQYEALLKAIRNIELLLKINNGQSCSI